MNECGRSGLVFGPLRFNQRDRLGERAAVAGANLGGKRRNLGFFTGRCVHFVGSKTCRVDLRMLDLVQRPEFAINGRPYRRSDTDATPIVEFG